MRNKKNLIENGKIFIETSEILLLLRFDVLWAIPRTCWRPMWASLVGTEFTGERDSKARRSQQAGAAAAAAAVAAAAAGAAVIAHGPYVGHRQAIHGRKTSFLLFVFFFSFLSFSQHQQQQQQR